MSLLPTAAPSFITDSSKYVSLAPSERPATLSLPMPTYEEANQAYWGLGVEDCWKQQGIDGRDHRHGKWVYDLGKHEKRVKEPGYWASTFAAMQFVSRPNVLMEDLSVELYQGIHKVACRHFEVQTKHQAGKKAIGKFFVSFNPYTGGPKHYQPLKCDLICSTPEGSDDLEKQLQRAASYDCLLRPSFSCPHPEIEHDSEFEYQFQIFKRYNPGVYSEDATVDQFKADYKKTIQWLKDFRRETDQKIRALNAQIREQSTALGLSDPIGEFDHDYNPEFRSTFLKSYRVCLTYKCTQEELEPLVARLFAEYNEKMKVAVTREARLRNIAELFQMLEWIHPFADGQGRTDWLILNKELCRWGFTPAILHEPYVSSLWTLDEWIAYLEDGMKRWQKERDALMVSALENVTFFV